MRISDYLKLILLLVSFTACEDAANTNSTENLQRQASTTVPADQAPSAPNTTQVKQEEATPVIQPVGKAAITIAEKELPKTGNPEKNETKTSGKAKATPVVKPKIEVPAPAEAVEEKNLKPAPGIKEIVQAVAPIPDQQEKVTNPAPGGEVALLQQTKEAPSAPSAGMHEEWNNLVAKYVSSSGSVNYKGIKSNADQLNAYLKTLADNPVQDSWPRAKKMAYWINAYNAFTVKLIIDNYPVSSITHLHGGKPWDVKWIQLGSKTYSLNSIEHDILRPQFKDARIHFAVNCAAKSCPPLLNLAWTENNLESNLEKQAKTFINNAAFNSIGKNSVKISKIFEWYRDDFGDLINYLNKYSDTKADKNAKVSFHEYNWALNE